DADNPGPQSLTPVRIDGGPGKTEVYNKVPGRMRPLPTPGQIFGMEQQNSHSIPFANTTISISLMRGQANPSSRAFLARYPAQHAALRLGANVAGAIRRSEERRVGKGCRWLGWTEAGKWSDIGLSEQR